MTAEEAQKRAIKGIAKGAPQDDLEDGDLDDLVLLRRADLRGGRARAGARRPPLHRHAVADRRDRHRRCSPARRSTATPAPTRGTATCSRSAACTRGAPTASTTSGTPRRSRCSSTRCATAATTTYEEYSRLVNEEAARKATLRGLLRVQRKGGRIPLDEVEPAAEIVKRFSTGAMSLGSLGARGARDARDRDEPARRQVEHRRGRRGPGALRRATRTATRAARRSSRSPRAASA